MQRKLYETPFYVDLYPKIQHEDVCEQIKSFSALKDGWDYGHGYGISKSVIKNACYIFNNFHRTAFKYSANPTSDGSVKITANLEIDFIDLTIKPDLSITLTHEKGIGSEYEIISEVENITMDDIERYLNEILTQSCFLSERYTSGSTIQTNNDLTATHLETTKGVFPLLTAGVYNQIIYCYHI